MESLSPIITPHCPTGLYPAWIPAGAALPDSCRCVLVTDGDGVWVGCWAELPDGTYHWEDVQTEEEFDSVITHWMELPLPPEI